MSKLKTIHVKKDKPRPIDSSLKMSVEKPEPIQKLSRKSISTVKKSKVSKEEESHISEDLSQYLGMKSSAHHDYGVYSEYQYQKTEKQSVIHEYINVEDDSGDDDEGIEMLKEVLNRHFDHESKKEQVKEAPTLTINALDSD